MSSRSRGMMFAELPITMMQPLARTVKRAEARKLKKQLKKRRM